MLCRRARSMKNDPTYFSYFTKPLRVFEKSRGRRVGEILDLVTGEFVEADNDTVLHAVSPFRHSEVDEVSFEDFVIETEALRAHELSGTGPAFALYAVAKGVFDSARAEGRLITDEEHALITSIYLRTFALWEAGAAGSLGPPPSA